MKILAVDTATEACSAALLIDNEIQQTFTLAPREHTKLILPMVQNLLNEADVQMKQLDAIAFGRGPGSFTGVRIATGVAQGLAYGADLPVVAISTLASMAQSIYQQHQHSKVLAAIDARMGDVYWGCYQLNAENLMCLKGDEIVIAPQNVPLVDDINDANWAAAGTGWAVYETVLQQTLKHQFKSMYGSCLPEAKSIAQLAVAAFNKGYAVEPALAQPVYLRNNVAKKSKAAKKTVL